MILTDSLNIENRHTWDIAKACGVTTGDVRLPEKDFDVTDFSQMKAFYDTFVSEGITPIAIEPMPNHLHDHIKTADDKRDESIEKVIKMFANLDKLNVRLICFNWMAHVGWCRTSSDLMERGGSSVTGFDLEEYEKNGNIASFDGREKCITKRELWDNYEYFINAVMPYADKYNIKMALHPDDPPLERLGKVERIMTSYENINKAINLYKSDNLGVTFCQATYYTMGEDLYKVIPLLKDKIFFVHFRNVIGNKYKFRETCHDNGSIDMAKALKCYIDNGIDVPIRVDHVPTLASEKSNKVGYGDLGRLYAIGYLKGLLDGLEKTVELKIKKEG